MTNLLILFFYQPFLNGLVFFYNTLAFQDLGVAIILLTLAVRILLFPLFQKLLRQQRVLQQIQPHIARIQKEHGQDKTKQAEALMKVYQENNINPFSPLLLLAVQLPILIGLYRVLMNIFKPGEMALLYSFISAPAVLHDSFLGLLSLQNPSIVVVLLAAAAQYWQARQTAPKGQPNQAFLLLLGPMLTLFILPKLPSAIALYWLATSLFSVAQQALLNYTFKKNGPVGGTR